MPSLGRRSIVWVARKVRPLSYPLAVEAIDELRNVYSDVPALADCDQGKIESALNQPFQSAGGRDAFRTDLEKIAAFMYYLAKSHMCWTGVKRITAALTLALLDLNQLWLVATNDELEQLILVIAESQAAHQHETMELIRNWCHGRVQDQVPTPSAGGLAP